MRLHRTSRTVLALTAVVALGLSAAACGRGSSKSGSGGKKIGIDFPRSDSDFWNSYAKYVNADVSSGKMNALPATNSNNKTDVLVSNVTTLEGQGAKVILMAPQDTGAIASTLEDLAEQAHPGGQRGHPPGQGRRSTWWCARTTRPTAPRPASSSATSSRAPAGSWSSRAT